MDMATRQVISKPNGPWLANLKGGGPDWLRDAFYLPSFIDAALQCVSIY